MILVCHLQEARAAEMLFSARLLLQLAPSVPSISDSEGSLLRTRTVEATTQGPRWPLKVLLHGANTTIDHPSGLFYQRARIFSARGGGAAAKAWSTGGGGGGDAANKPDISSNRKALLAWQPTAGYAVFFG
jgi:hypothetical protein